MSASGELIIINKVMHLKVSKTPYPLAKDMQVPQDLEGLYSDDFELNGGEVTRLVVEDDDGETHTFVSGTRRQPGNQGNGRGGQGRGNNRGGNPQPNNQREQEEERRKKNENRYRNPARAPYNFIPLNGQVLSHTTFPGHDQFYPGHYSGSIEVTITNLTAFFIRKEKDIRDFFSMNGKPFIPGASLRGLIRSWVEMVTWSELGEGFFTDQQLSFRAIADMGFRFRDAYKAEILPNRKTEEIKGGYLTYNAVQKKYFIQPAEATSRFESTSDAKLPEPEGGGYRIYSGFMQGKKRQWKVGAPRNVAPIEVHSDLEKAYRDDSTRKTKLQGRQQELNLLQEVKENAARWPRGYPIFYNETAGAISSFGHTPNYRIPYNLSIADHLQQQWKDAKETTDMAKAIFGAVEGEKEGKKKKAWAGRVFFEDSYLTADAGTFPEARTQMLLGPKPTTFQHYLQQPSGVRTPMEDLRHWGDTDAPLRGYKFYWHRVTPADGSTHSWILNGTPRNADEGARGTDQVPLKALRPGAVFRGHIRFDNLSGIELGALLFVLNLPEHCCHKLGLGKPIGLGTVKISTQLHLIRRAERYTKLWSDDLSNWNTAQERYEDPSVFKHEFETYMLGQLDTSHSNLWHTPRLKQLRRMAEFHPEKQASTDWLSKTRYMEIKRPVLNPDGSQKMNPRTGNPMTENEYINRPVLPQPDEVQPQSFYPPTQS